MNRSKVVIVLLACLTLFAGSLFSAGSQETSSKSFFDQTVKIIIPYGPGGTHDVVSRKFAEVGSKYTNRPIICENVTGGDGIVAAIQFTQKRPNVPELLCTSYGKYYQKIIRGDQIRLDLSLIDPVGVFDDRSYILYARNDGQFKNLNEVIAESKKRTVILSAGAVGADAHLAFGGLINAAGGSSKIASYEGGAQQITALINGEADVFVGTSQVGMQYVETGAVIPIATFTDKDYTGFKGFVVPNVVDLGYPESAIIGGGFLSVRAGTDQKYIDEVEALMRKVWSDPDFRDWTESIGLNIFELYGEELDAHIEFAVKNATTAAKSLGLI